MTNEMIERRETDNLTLRMIKAKKVSTCRGCRNIKKLKANIAEFGYGGVKTSYSCSLFPAMKDFVRCIKYERN